MKICFLVVNLSCGGVERTVTYLSEYFANHGVDTSIICISDEQFYDIDTSVYLKKLNISSNNVSYTDRVMKVFKRYIGIYKSLDEIKPDCVICLDVEMLRYIRLQHFFRHFKIITSERNNPLMDEPEKKKRKYYFFRRSDGIVFQTERAKKCFPIDIASKGVVISNAVGNDLILEAIIKKTRRNVITSVGRLTKQKDFLTLLKAFKIFIKSNSYYKLEIYGKGEQEEELKKFVEENNMADSVIFKGAIKNAIVYVASSSCYVMSSLYEGMPNALMEAMAVGVPCVSTDCPFGPAELIDNGVNGLLVPVGDAEALSSAMERMINDKKFASRCAKNAMNIMENHSRDLICELYLKYANKIVKGIIDTD